MQPRSPIISLCEDQPSYKAEMASKESLNARKDVQKYKLHFSPQKTIPGGLALELGAPT
jgi:hypothetical protein